jgi:phosphosulfolactate synthase (CoM biosynthesis protein A)
VRPSREQHALSICFGGHRTEPVSRIIEAIGTDKTMFEAADPAVFEWYIKNYGPEVNLLVDHSQIVQLQCLRSGIWGTKSSWGRIAGFRLPG